MAVDSNTDDQKSTNLSANLHFLKRDPKYDTTKPYTCRFDTEGKFPYTNIENVKQNVPLTNIRPIQNDVSLQTQGFSIITIPERMSYEDLNDDEKIRGEHIPNILTTIQTELEAKEIHVLDYRVRKRDVEFPIRSDQEYEYLQPSSRVHLDYTKAAIEKLVHGHYESEAAAILDRPWKVINVWHPLRGPCVDWPLAVCDSSTVDYERDIIASDFVDSWGYSENMQVHHREEQRWYYLDGQMPNELLVFKSADSEEGKKGVFPGAPHGSFDNPNKGDDDLPRQSLELRLLVTY